MTTQAIAPAAAGTPRRPVGFVELCGWLFVLLMPMLALPLGVAGILILVVLLPYLVLFRSSAMLARPIVWLVILGGYLLTSAILAGVPVTMFAEFSFWRRDGKFFIAYLPLLVASLMALDARTLERMLRAVVLIATVIAAIGIVEYTLGLFGVHPFALFVHRGVENSGKLVFTMSRANSHNAVGGYYAILSVLTFGQLLAGHWSRRWWLVFFVLGIAVLCTLSRAFVFALVIVVAAAGVAWGGRRVIGILLVGAIFATPFLAGGFLKRVVELRNPTEVYNARVRLEYWARAADYIQRSPWLGVGFSRFNDVPVASFTGIPGILQRPRAAPVVHSDGHAHNAVLMIWAETGVLGLLLWGGFIGSIIRLSRQRYRDLRLPSAVRGFAYGSVMSFGVLLAASLVAFNIVTPSSVWPAGFFAGASLGLWRLRDRAAPAGDSSSAPSHHHGT